MNWNQWGPAHLHSRIPSCRPMSMSAARGLVLEDAASGFTGAIVRTEKSGGVHLVVLEGRRGVTRSFPLGLGFMIDGQSVNLVPPSQQPKTAPARTASGSRAVGPQRARVALASRTWIEVVHD